jgi:hypothetical protein
VPARCAGFFLPEGVVQCLKIFIFLADAMITLSRKTSGILLPDGCNFSRRQKPEISRDSKSETGNEIYLPARITGACSDQGF